MPGNWILISGAFLSKWFTISTRDCGRDIRNGKKYVEYNHFMKFVVLRFISSK